MAEEVKEKKTDPKPCCQHKEKKLYKISDLPLYGNPYPRPERVMSEEIGYIESGVKTIREEVSPYFSVVTDGSQRAKEILNTAYEHSKSTYEYISSEGNTVAKAAAITGGGLIGLLLATRKGFFKKLLYTSAGLTAASAACYPKEAKELSQIGFFIVTTKGPEIIKEYTGVDLTKKKDKSSVKTEPKSIDQIGEEVSDVHYYGFRVSEAPSSKKSESNAKTSNEQKSSSQVKGDFGQSRKDDQDLYANRSTK